VSEGANRIVIRRRSTTVDLPSPRGSGRSLTCATSEARFRPRHEVPRLSSPARPAGSPAPLLYPRCRLDSKRTPSPRLRPRDPSQEHLLAQEVGNQPRPADRITLRGWRRGASTNAPRPCTAQLLLSALRLVRAISAVYPGARRRRAEAPTALLSDGAPHVSPVSAPPGSRVYAVTPAFAA
jgi:hypothetical protein